MCSPLDQLVHRAGQFLLDQEGAQIALPLLFEHIEEPPVGVQTPRPVVGSIRLLRGADQVAQGIDSRVAACLKLAVGRLQQEASAVKTHIRQRFAHRHQNHRRYFIEALGKFAVTQIQRGCQGPDQPRHAGVIA